MVYGLPPQRHRAHGGLTEDSITLLSEEPKIDRGLAEPDSTAFFLSASLWQVSPKTISSERWLRHSGGRDLAARDGNDRWRQIELDQRYYEND